MQKIPATFIVNGDRYDLMIDSHALLVEVLRDELGFRGVHESCGEGDCGACTVLVDNVAILSCITLAASVSGKSITTVEGLAKGPKLDPIQNAFVKYGAVQCGYCTPGMVMAAKHLLDENPHPSQEEVKKGMAGNLCRCTGYNKIIEAVLAAANGGE